MRLIPRRTAKRLAAARAWIAARLTAWRAARLLRRRQAACDRDEHDWRVRATIYPESWTDTLPAAIKYRHLPDEPHIRVEKQFCAVPGCVVERWVTDDFCDVCRRVPRAPKTERGFRRCDACRALQENSAIKIA